MRRSLAVDRAVEPRPLEHKDPYTLKCGLCQTTKSSVWVGWWLRACLVCDMVPFWPRGPRKETG